MLLESKKGTKVYNVNVEAHLESGGQAPAVFVNGLDHGFYGVKMTGHHSTLCANKGPQVYAKSYINGAVDFITGLHARSWFQTCDLESFGDSGAITAVGHGNDPNPSVFIFSNVCSATPMRCTPQRQLPRSSGLPHARVVFQDSELSAVVNPKGWDRTHKDDEEAYEDVSSFNNRKLGAGITPCTGTPNQNG